MKKYSGTNRSGFVLIVVMAVLAFAPLADFLHSEETVRSWTVPGRPSVTATLITKENDTVVLRTADGKDHRVPISRLSQEDQAYINKASPSAPPPAGTPAPGTPTPVPATGTGGLADLRPGQALNETQRAEVGMALDKAFEEKSWKSYHETVTSGVHQLLGKLNPRLGDDAYLEATEDPSTFALFAHERFFKRIPEDQLTRLISTEEWQPFSRWLMGRPDVAEAFINALEPTDKLPQVFDVWRRCWEEVPESRKEYAKVAVACALVFDRPVTVRRAKGVTKEMVDPVERCRDYIAAATEGQLKTRLQDLPVNELVWVVCANVSSEDLAWARKKMRLTQKSAGQAYAMVQYLMEKATDGVNPYKTYTLEEILDVGGVCADQAHFSANTARALGIPAYVVSGDGDRGPHAWLGYKKGKGEWDSTTGRYRGYRTGMSRSPQTGERVREQVFHLWNESDFSDTAKFNAGNRLRWMSEIYHDLENVRSEVELARFAVEKTPRIPAVLNRLVEALSIDPEAGEDDWKAVITDIRRNYRHHPDMLTKAADLEREHIPLEGNEEELISNIGAERRAIQRKDGERSDIAVLLYQREADIYFRKEDLDSVLDVYQKAFRDLSGDVPAFKQLARDLATFVTEHASHRREAFKTIDRHYRDDIVTGSSEYFRQQSEASVAKLIEKLKVESGGV